MLKGLKKSKASQPQTQEVSTVRSSVNENQLKIDTLIEEQQLPQLSADEQIINRARKEELSLYQHCYELFLNGSPELLSEKLQLIKDKATLQRKYDKTAKVEGQGKFDYEMNFQQDQREKTELKKRSRPIMASNRIKDYCIYCPDNEELELLSASNYVYLALPKYKTFKNYFHLVLAPVDHEQTMIGLNQDILTEINNYKKCLLQAFDKINMQVVFFEQYSKENSHIYIECLPMSYAKAEDLPFFFKQGLEDVEGNWSTHKTIIKIQKDKGGLQKQIPKPIKYFYIDFSLGYGYAHVIENEREWKREFCYEILATGLGLQQHLIKTTEEFSPEQKAIKRENFIKIWSSFDWTQLI